MVNGESSRACASTRSQPPGLRQSQRLTARILLDTRKDVLMVARGPFLDQEGGSAAYVMDGNTAVRRPITAGASSLSAVEIVEGLQPGERVVVAGTDLFDNADRIRISGLVIMHTRIDCPFPSPGPPTNSPAPCRAGCRPHSRPAFPPTSRPARACLPSHAPAQRGHRAPACPLVFRVR